MGDCNRKIVTIVQSVYFASNVFLVCGIRGSVLRKRWPPEWSWKVGPATETTLQTNYNIGWMRKNDYSAGIINTYWARWSKISWFFKVSSINYLPKPKALSDKSRYFAITEFHNCFIIRSLFFWSTKDVKSLSHSSGDRLASHADVHVGEETRDERLRGRLGTHLPFFTQERGFNYPWARYYSQQNTCL